ncbi:MAG: response regulator transcription factor, partial [Lachnospiraceae bacterium]|nr:response regulator transcription factor [Lachnospiraceae bacterium]
MDKLKVLIADDESRMRKLVGDFLSKNNFEVLEAENGEQAIDVFFSTKDIALVILDVMMPKLDGWQVCREIREHSAVPIIMLTAKSDERDELLGFELGVDEYVTKPFSPKVLVARIDAILRRSNAYDEDTVEVGGITIDKTAHIVKIDGRTIDLSVKEFELLSYFIL